MVKIGQLAILIENNACWDPEKNAIINSLSGAYNNRGRNISHLSVLYKPMILIFNYSTNDSEPDSPVATFIDMMDML